MKFKRHVGEQEEDTNLWIGYCAFHLGDYKRALEVSLKLFCFFFKITVGFWNVTKFCIIIIHAYGKIQTIQRGTKEKGKKVTLSAFLHPVSLLTGVNIGSLFDVLLQKSSIYIQVYVAMLFTLSF